MRLLSIFTIVTVISCASCQDQNLDATKSTQQATPDTAQKDNENSAKLEAMLRAADGTFTTDSVRVHFTVVNESDTAQRFCKWETPFEPVLGKYMEITDEQGTEAAFNGAMARRVMPPPPEAYIEVPPHDSVSTVYNIAKNYTLAKGQRYTVKYTGGGVSGLQAGNEIKISVP